MSTFNGFNDDRGCELVAVDALRKNPIGMVELLDTNVEVDRRCTVFACFPWLPMEERRFGVVFRVPGSIDELLHMASQHFACTYNHVVNEDMGEILDATLIRDSERVFVVNTVS